MKNILIALSLISVFGIADASWLTYHALAELPIPCSVFEGCNEVASSPYSKVGGIPLAAFGVFFYSVVLILSLVLLYRERMFLVRLLQLAGFVGFALSAYFMYLQAFVIGAFCIYCIASAISSTTIFVLSLFLKRSAV